MVESVRANGVLMPIIARRANGIVEILSGHNRVNAARLAGLSEVPAIILENIPDSLAMVYVIETNLMQRSFADMAHSEKAAVIATQHSKLFSQGKRNDILKELDMLENPHEYRGYGTCAQIAHKLKSREIVASEYGLSKDTIARYLRADKIIPSLKLRLDRGDIAFIPAVTLSFLNDNEQLLLVNCMDINRFTVDMKKADTLRQYSEKGKLDEERIYLILSGEIGPKAKPNRTPTVKVSKTVYAKYFKPSQSAYEIQSIVEKALDMYFENTG
jgi:ParB family chromosome partitioning protein